jgi:hypothetical protein
MAVGVTAGVDGQGIRSCSAFVSSWAYVRKHISALMYGERLCAARLLSTKWQGRRRRANRT